MRDILEQYKIGKLAGGASEAAMVKIEDPFKNDPHRHPALLARSAKPFNGETPGELLVGATKAYKRVLLRAVQLSEHSAWQAHHRGLQHLQPVTCALPF